MEWGDSGLIIEAAAENAFDFKSISPQDNDYELKLHLIKNHFQRKRLETVSMGVMLYKMLLCIQRTIARADDLYGESAYKALMNFVEFASGYLVPEAETKKLSLDEEIEVYKERYKQEYGS